MTKHKNDQGYQPKSDIYRRFLAEAGTTATELQELFAQEVMHLSPEDLHTMKDGNFYSPDTLTEAQVKVSLHY